MASSSSETIDQSPKKPPKFRHISSRYLSSPDSFSSSPSSSSTTKNLINHGPKQKYSHEKSFNRIPRSPQGKENQRSSIGGGFAKYSANSPSALSSSSSSDSFSINSHDIDLATPRRRSIDGSEISTRSNPGRFLHKHDLSPRYSQRLAVQVSSSYSRESPITVHGIRRSFSNVTKSSDCCFKYNTPNSKTMITLARSDRVPQWDMSLPVSPKRKTMSSSLSCSKLKQPFGSPRRGKDLIKLFNQGDDKEMVHQLRLLHNRLIQWRFANARTDRVNVNNVNQVETNLSWASESLAKLRMSVVEKRLQVQKKKLEMKLSLILNSYINELQPWEEINIQFVSALSSTIESLHSVACRVPLIRGAKVNLQSASEILSHTLYITDSIASMLTNFLPQIEKTVSFTSQLAEVVVQEKAMLEECYELVETLSTLQIPEMNLKCSVIQLKV